MSRDPGDIPRAAGGGQADLVAALSRARDLPAEALARAAAQPSRVAPAVLDALRRAAAGQTLSEPDGNLLFWGIHALAEAGETRMLRPLLALMRLDEEDLDAVVGDTVTETLPRIVVSTFDGDWPALREAIVDPALNGAARWSLFLALAYLTTTGRVAREEASALLSGFDDERPVGSSDLGWNGWADAIALLGLRDLAPRVAAARGDARLLDEVCLSPEEFEAALAEAGTARPGDLARFAARRLGPFGSAVDELDAMLRLGSDEDEEPAGGPVRNPLRDVGRNDPCPCGSGRKFKKCCLAA